ncbi:SDR family oxidoreductase [Lederbergia sp. NSJ-179]|uniref:SDR family oxidoreductase n=1 Tax=Lederbergia sp. NSJ-179 TaxID=2931402 RepID=UPI001FD4416E|nr:SDR family oxidoreductase [Lederbergia sp. NSJ-179]MCJ7842821.1 SDR family oxidoreductase [Lederbergia sp. NSJ-179]
MEFEGKSAFITGASSGIGRTVAIELAKRGASVFIADINEKGGRETVAMIKENGGESQFQRTDITNEQDVIESVSLCNQMYNKIDFAINNAGIIIGAMLADLSEEDWDKVINVNLKGTWLCMKHEIQLMKKQQFGSIVNTSSIAGKIGLKHHAAYVPSKHGIIGLTKTAALEYGKYGIRVNAVCPGTVHTSWVHRVTKKLSNLHPLGRIAETDEIAEAIIWLSSEKSSYVTGHSLVIDGGRTAGEQ